MSEEVLSFLDRVWGDRASWVDLPSKSGGHWIPFYARWPDAREVLARRIESCLEDSEDIYFSVAQFSGRGRRIADTMPTRWLWADLDKVDPVFLDEDGLQPTLAWESSPGRHQCLWELTKELAPAVTSKLSRALTYAIGADSGGWDLTQVLRPPGTINHKYSPPAPVELYWDNGKTLSPRALLSAIRAIEPEHSVRQPVATVLSSADPSSGRAQKHSLPARARRLLKTPSDMIVVGERSDRLWELECLLAESGLDEEEIFDLVWDSAWAERWKEVNTGADQLHKEIQKAIKKVAKRVSTDYSPNGRPGDDVRESTDNTQLHLAPGEDLHSESRTLSKDDGTSSVADVSDDADADLDHRRHATFVDYANFLSTNIEAPRWLVEDIWSSSSHGIIGGEPKTHKSVLALALALSVASGKDFLGAYQVRTSGPVLVIQEENAPWQVQDRLRKLARFYGLIKRGDIEMTKAGKGSIASKRVRLDFPADVPLRLLNNWGFDLTDPDCQDILEEEVARVGARMVVLDPLAWMLGDVDENKTWELRGVLRWLMQLRYRYELAVVVVHHMGKSGSGGQGQGQNVRRSGQRLAGSHLFHGWIESALYTEPVTVAPDTTPLGGVNIRVEREFRNVAPRGPLGITFHMGEPGSLKFEASVSAYSAVNEVLTLIQVRGENGMALGTLADLMAVDRKEAMRRAVGAGCVLQGGGRGKPWVVYPPGFGEDG